MVWFAGNIKTHSLDEQGSHFCAVPVEPSLFVSIYLNVGDEQKPVTGVNLLTCRISRPLLVNLYVLL